MSRPSGTIGGGLSEWDMSGLSEEQQLRVNELMHRRDALLRQQCQQQFSGGTKPPEVVAPAPSETGFGFGGGGGAGGFDFGPSAAPTVPPSAPAPVPGTTDESEFVLVQQQHLQTLNNLGFSQKTIELIEHLVMRFSSTSPALLQRRFAELKEHDTNMYDFLGISPANSGSTSSSNMYDVYSPPDKLGVYFKTTRLLWS
jgi:hypothetical protein